MPEYQHSQTISAAPDDVFGYLADVRNLPSYLPTLKHVEQPSSGRIRVQGQVKGHTYDADGHFRVDLRARRMEWGADETDRYQGWLTVDEGGTDDSCLLTVQLTFGPNLRFSSDGRDPSQADPEIQHGLEESLRSIQRVVEGKGGKIVAPGER